MSETITFANGAQAKIYGTLAGALAYLGAETTDWDAVATDEDLQRLLVRATRYLDRLPWASDYETFAARDALDLADGSIGDAAFPFRAACYEIARLAFTDDSVLGGGVTDDTVASMSAGGASITFRDRSRESQSYAETLPPSVLVLIGAYLATDVTVDAAGGASSTGSDTNPFGPGSDFDREEPW